MPTSSKYFVVEGNIGAGKSTFLKIIKQHLNTTIVYEPVDKWQNIAGDNLLERFYSDTSRWAYTFQTYAFITRILEHELHSHKNAYPFLVCERSVYSDRYCFAANCAEAGLMSPLEWEIYKNWFSWLTESRMEKPSGFIYLQTDPEMCYERLLKRNRSEEAGVSIDYLKKLHERHEKWLIQKEELYPTLKNVPVLVLDCNHEFESSKARQQELINDIATFLSTQYNIQRDISLSQTSPL